MSACPTIIPPPLGIEVEIECEGCGGTGFEICETCCGEGKFDEFGIEYSCLDCYSTGRLKSYCKHCRGAGQITQFVEPTDIPEGAHIVVRDTDITDLVRRDCR